MDSMFPQMTLCRLRTLNREFLQRVSHVLEASFHYFLLFQPLGVTDVEGTI